VLLGGLVLFTCGAAACMVAANMPMRSRGAYCRERGRGAASCWRAPSPATYTVRTELPR
jgi:hypothetical protein